MGCLITRDRGSQPCDPDEVSMPVVEPMPIIVEGVR